VKIIHFYPRSSGISFLRIFQRFLQETYDSNYVFYDKSERLITDLAGRINNTDIVIFTAHGTEDYIIGDYVKGEHVLLTSEKLTNLRNSFVFAFSCSTGVLGERLCSEHNVISYIGFNDIVDLSVRTADVAFKEELSRVLKDIYNDALQKSFYTFIEQNYDIGQFAKLISLNLKRSFSKVLAMDNTELSHRFNISRGSSSNHLFIRKLHSDLLTTIDSVRSRIVLHGEESFIPWGFLINDAEKIYKLIAKFESLTFSSNNEYYRFFILAVLNIRIGRFRTAFRFYKKAVTLFPEYEPLKIFSFDVEDESQLSDTEVV
jgi:hypothetical protein